MRSVLVGLVFLLLVGCSGPLKDVRSELREGGWDLWYPAEAGIRPGDIWSLSGDGRDLVMRCPDTPTAPSEQLAQFRSLKRAVNVTASVAGSGSLGPLVKPTIAGQLLSESTENVELVFGETYIERLSLEDVEAIATTSPAYETAVNAIDTGVTSNTILTSIVKTRGLKYIVKAKDNFDAQATADAISRDLGVKVAVKSNSMKEYVFETPMDAALVIGARGISGPFRVRSTSHSTPTTANSDSSALYLGTVQVESQPSFTPSIHADICSSAVSLVIPYNASKLVFQMKDTDAQKTRFDLQLIMYFAPTVLAPGAAQSIGGGLTTYLVRGARFNSPIDCTQFRGGTLQFHFANVRSGPQRTLTVEVFAK